jgi:hypothetical protein
LSFLCSKIFREEGVLAFFKGSGLAVTYVALLFGIAQAVYYLGISQKLSRMTLFRRISKDDEPIVDRV